MIQGLLARFLASALVVGGGGLALERNTEDLKPSQLLTSAEAVARDVSEAKPIANLKDGWNQSLRSLQEAVYEELTDLNKRNRAKCERALEAELRAKGLHLVSLTDVE